LASHPSHEAELLAAGRLTPAHIAAREWLRGAMASGGFVGIPNEWWHFDHGDRDVVRRTMARVL
jgi:zinc D-Ala-D-Ala dipeptidase